MEAALVRNHNSILLGVSNTAEEQYLLLSRVNRHGLVAGATGTGKTVTLTSLAHKLAASGVSVFAPDVKGDLAAIAKVTPTRFWDLTGQRGETISVSIRDIGPALFSRLVDATEAQERTITILFAVARKYSLPLETIQDVRHVLSYINANSSDVEREFGAVSTSASSVIMGKLLMMEESGAGDFFGQTSFSLDDIWSGGIGAMNVLRAETLIHNPSLYATFLFWLLNELFTKLPEVGDQAKPKMVFFFDEAHLLFQNASRPFLQKVEQVVRLIRSKGVGVFFVTQSPADIPDSILAQLGNRIQHALRAYTPTEQKALRAAASSFRPNPAFDTAEAIQSLGVGEALVSLLDERGTPSIVQWTRIAKSHIPTEGRDQVIRKEPPVRLAVVNSDVVVPLFEAPLPVMVFDDRPVEPLVVSPPSITHDPFAGQRAFEDPLPLTEVVDVTPAPKWATQRPKARKGFRIWTAALLVVSTATAWFSTAFVAM